MNISNTQRVFDSVLSIDAWHTEFEPATHVAGVHVDVSFLRGKLGEEPSSPVRFQIALKRAEIIFIIPSNEPLKVIQASVKRDPPLMVKQRVSINSASDIKLRGSAGFDVTKMSGGLSAEASGSVGRQATHSSEYENTVGAITWSQTKDMAGNYRWELAPTIAYPLLGKAWDAISEPLLKIRSLTTSRVIDAVSRIEIWCRREDLLISAIEIKEQGTWAKLLGSPGLENRMAAAEAYIRNALASKHLDIRNFEDPFGHVKLADIVVEPAA